MQAGKSRSPGEPPQQSPVGQWDNIIKFLDSLMSRLCANHVCFCFIGLFVTILICALRFFFFVQSL